MMTIATELLKILLRIERKLDELLKAQVAEMKGVVMPMNAKILCPMCHKPAEYLNVVRESDGRLDQTVVVRRCGCTPAARDPIPGIEE